MCRCVGWAWLRTRGKVSFCQFSSAKPPTWSHPARTEKSYPGAALEQSIPSNLSLLSRLRKTPTPYARQYLICPDESQGVSNLEVALSSAYLHFGLGLLVEVVEPKTLQSHLFLFLFVLKMNWIPLSH